MITALHRLAAALALGSASAPCCARGAAAMPSGALSVILAMLWLLALGWGFHALLRRHLRYDDRLDAVLTQLGTERRARALAERALADTHCALCKLVEQQEAVRDSERQRIGRDIHDDLGQNLLALKIDLSMLHLSTAGAHPVLNEKLGSMIGNVDTAIKSLRTIINDLRPLGLETGLRHAMEHQLHEFSRVSGIAHQLDVTDDAFSACHDQTHDAILFRILQEALANVVRHARATKVRVALQKSDGQLQLAVQDNGVGMPPGPVPHPCGGGDGLQGMRQRVRAIGGQFAIDSKPGVGTLITLTIPLSKPISMH